MVTPPRRDPIDQTIFLVPDLSSGTRNFFVYLVGKAAAIRPARGSASGPAFENLGFRSGAVSAKRYMPASRLRDEICEQAIRGSGLPAGPARTAALKSLGYAQAEKTPERLDALVEAWPTVSDRDAVLSGMAKNLADSGSPRAPDFARLLGGSVERERAFETIAWSWPVRDQSAARAWIALTPELSAEQKRVLIREFDSWKTGS